MHSFSGVVDDSHMIPSAWCLQLRTSVRKGEDESSGSRDLAGKHEVDAAELPDWTFVGSKMNCGLNKAVF